MIVAQLHDETLLGFATQMGYYVKGKRRRFLPIRHSVQASPDRSKYIQLAYKSTKGSDVNNHLSGRSFETGIFARDLVLIYLTVQLGFTLDIARCSVCRKPVLSNRF